MGTRALATVTAFLLLVATQFVLATSALASGRSHAREES